MQGTSLGQCGLQALQAEPDGYPPIYSFYVHFTFIHYLVYYSFSAAGVLCTLWGGLWLLLPQWFCQGSGLGWSSIAAD